MKTGKPMKRYAPLLLVLIAFLSLTMASGCADDGQTAVATAPLVCETAADCTVKNVGNCCGYYPQCVHKDQSVDPEAVKKECEAKGVSGVCGFPEIDSCSCVQGQCVNGAQESAQ